MIDPARLPEPLRVLLLPGVDTFIGHDSLQLRLREEVIAGEESDPRALPRMTMVSDRGSGIPVLESLRAGQTEDRITNPIESDVDLKNPVKGGLIPQTTRATGVTTHVVVGLLSEKTVSMFLTLVKFEPCLALRTGGTLDQMFRHRTKMTTGKLVSRGDVLRNSSQSNPTRPTLTLIPQRLIGN
jgi:hypothetical protein